MQGPQPPAASSHSREARRQAGGGRRRGERGDRCVHARQHPHVLMDMWLILCHRPHRLYPHSGDCMARFMEEANLIAFHGMSGCIGSR